MRIFVKICGLSTPGGVAAAVMAGADAIGFVFSESPRRVTPKRARQLCADVSPVIIRVAVMRHPAAADWQGVADGFELDWLQTDAEDFAGLDMPGKFGRLPVYRDTPALDGAGLVPGLRADEPMLFEAAVSGEGARANWEQAAALARGWPLILAGGLTPDNVGQAIATVRPWGVDVSSGVESKRGVKDIGRISAFIEAVREAELAHARVQ
ncbi:MAG: phosphoribosylanthranilate isomerase [Gammaproteobacteria bacterium]